MTQRGPRTDKLKDLIDDTRKPLDRDFRNIRQCVAQRTYESQKQQKRNYDCKRKKPKQYQKGDLVMVRNFDTTAGVNKKMIPRFKGPYEISKILRNDRYVIIDPQGLQNTQRAFTGVWEVGNMRSWICSKTLTQTLTVNQSTLFYSLYPIISTVIRLVLV